MGSLMKLVNNLMNNPRLGSRPFAFILIGLLSIIWVLSYQSIKGHVVSLEDEIAWLKEDVSRQKAILEHEPELREYFSTLRASAVADNDSDRAAAFIEELGTRAREQDLALNNLRPLPVEKNGKLTITRVSLSVEGTLEPLTRFIHSTLNGSSITMIEELKISPKKRHSTRLEAELIFAMISPE